MIIAIDEAGDFSRNSNLTDFYVAIQIRDVGNIVPSFRGKLTKWENSLDESWRNRTGEVKSRLVPESELFSIINKLFKSRKLIGITSVGFSARVNPVRTVRKHIDWGLGTVANVIIQYRKSGNITMAKEYEKFASWFRKLSYEQYAKAITLVDCIYDSLYNSVGVASVNRFDRELADICFKIDENFIKHKRNKKYWLELLRNMLRAVSREKPLPRINTWNEKKHPFLLRYMENGEWNMAELFTERLDLYESSENFEIRIADIVATVYHKYHNKNRCVAAYNQLKKFTWHPRNSPLHITKLGDIRAFG